MAGLDRESAILITLIDRFILLSLPRALSLRKKVGYGNLLDEMDILLLKGLIQEALDNQRYIDTHPEMQRVFLQATSLYCDIVRRAMLNEESSLRLQ